MNKRALLFATVIGAAAFAFTPSAIADSGGNSSSAPSPNTTHTTGQPNQSCQTPGYETPGNAANAPGSAFNPSGNAGTHYAGQQPQNSQNPSSVAQYDVACSNQK